MRLNFLLVLVLCVGMVSAVSVCIDRSDPSAPANLSVFGEVENILLEWDAATDEPSCSEIDYYNISRDGDWIGQVYGVPLSFVDNDSLSEGEYTYTVYAVDKVGRNTGDAIKNIIQIDEGGNVRGGSYTGSSVCVSNWTCGEWTECLGNEQRRLCTDLGECGIIRSSDPETYRECGLMSQNGDLIFEDGEPEDGGVDGFFSTITGAVIGGGNTSVAIAGGFLILILGGLFIVMWKKRKKKSKK